MRIPNRSSVSARAMALVVIALGVASPAAAQFGLKKKAKAAAANEAAAKAAEAAGAEAPAAPTETGAAPAAAPARAGGGGTVVLTSDVVNRLIAGLKAGNAERERAKQADTPYGRYHKGVATAAAAEPKCQAAQMAWGTRAADEKVAARYTAAVDKAMAAQGKGDMKAYAMYMDSALAIMDPSCAVHRPEQPQNYYEMQRNVDSLAEQQTLKTAQFDATEFGQVMEKTLAILRDPAPADVSASESQVVKSHATELKDLMGMGEKKEAERAPKTAEPAPAPAPATAAGPTMPLGAGVVSECEVQNLKKHQAEVQALGDRGQKAMEAGNNGLMMAIADTIRQIQMAGCIRGK